MFKVTVYARHHSGLIRMGALQLTPAPDGSSARAVLKPPRFGSDGVALQIETDVLAGKDSGDLDWWHWQKEK